MESLLIVCLVSIVGILLIGYRRVSKSGNEQDWLFAYRTEKPRKSAPGRGEIR